MLQPNIYHSPLASRYASKEMLHLFSPYYKYLTWRKLWTALAKGERQLGLPITAQQIEALEKAQEDIDFDAITRYERQCKHEVVANIRAYADKAVESRGIIHLGATSCYVMDNTDLIQMREGLTLLQGKIVGVLRNLSQFSSKYASLPTLAYTHFQPAQPTTVGKRAATWLQDFLLDLKDLEFQLETIPFLGIKGATGTQASFYQLFAKDISKVEQLDQFVATEMGFVKPVTISTQTYSRKHDIRIFHVLEGLAVSSHKMATDLRLLSHLEEIEEPFEEDQIGSSAMPQKRNPMRSERVCALSRFVMSLSENPTYTAATQWLERTLDDSANRRLCIPEGFLATDAILNLLLNITASMTVYPKVIERNLQKEMPLLMLESILMKAVSKGKDRQEIHALLNKHALEAVKKRKMEGAEIDLLETLSRDKSLGLSLIELKNLVSEDGFTGISKEQVDKFIKEEVTPVLERYRHLPDVSYRLDV